MISAIISLYRADPYIDDFLYRLGKLKNVDDIEFIFVINDDQKREVSKKVKDFNVNRKIIETSRETLYASWNRAIKVSEGEYLCNLNCDDYHFYDSLEMMRQILDSSPEYALCSGPWKIVYKPVEAFDEENDPNRPSGLKTIEYNNVFCGPCPMWRKEVHEKIGLFEAAYQCVGDHEMWNRMLKNGYKFARISVPTAIYYDHPKTITNKSKGLKELY